MRARCAARAAGGDGRRARGEDALGWVRARAGVGSKVRRGCWEGVRRRVVACACDWWRWEERAYRVDVVCFDD